MGTILVFLGGLGLFMYGVQTTSDALQKFAAHRLKQILQSLTKKPFMAVLLGMVITVAFQSSAATTVLVVEFVNAGMMSLGQALGMVLGSAVGTSVSIQLIAFQILDIALGAIFIGFVLYFSGKKQWKHLGHSLIGFGLIFVGMSNMSNASAPLRNIPEVFGFLARLGSYPFLAILVGLILTTIIQSSTAVFAIMMSLAGQGLLELQAIVPLVIGAHIGGTVTTLLTSLTAKKMDAKRTALANTGYKVLAAVLMYPFLTQFTQLIQWTTGNLQRQVANAHLLFAVLMVIIFFPLNGLIAKGLKRMVPDRGDKDSPLKFQVIDEVSIEVPAVALKQANGEMRALGDFIGTRMMQKIPAILLANSDNLVEEISKVEEGVDWYYRHTMRFLAVLSQRGLTDEQAEESMKIQFIAKEFEYIGDAVMAMALLAKKLPRETMKVPAENWKHLDELYQRVSCNFAKVMQALTLWDSQIAAEVIREHPETSRIQRDLQFNFLAQCPQLNSQEGNLKIEEMYRYATLDSINLLYQVDEHTVNIAKVVMGIV
ncbi:Na/Pi cotransporter family protein [Desulfosporosinus meridiei]|uniref:Na/Pi-cotransporter n=1 Tax=Desulfosporosinus meridiei (strain ATCC BAA-275 / DSM 13257 / KCTC 12902 / NCIMB 13706 / S10) TaxID=768704 RepID=J7IX65_DESMD|nr:Na/Pi cotransporter family protein [Desulfosporosinus meridiei]AFQ46315.1 Na/Pi-cotransporter [Desulfosporosinus meridiei DSM 13257]